MKACQKIGIIIYLTALVFAPYVHAQEVLDPGVYATIKKNLLLEKLLEGRDPKTLSPNQLHDLLMQTASVTSIPVIGDITGQDGVYVASTGQTGEARGVVPWGVYEVLVNPIDKIRVTVPKTILVSSRTGVTVGVAMQEEKKTSLFKNITQKLTSFLSFLHKENPLPTQPVSEPLFTGELDVKLFKDENNNKIFDAGEKVVPWANVKIGLRKISHEDTVAFVAGENSFLVPQDGQNLKTTADIILQLSSREQVATDIRITDPENPTFAVAYKNGELFGTHFPLKPGQTYLIQVTAPVSFIVIHE